MRNSANTDQNKFYSALNCVYKIFDVHLLGIMTFWHMVDSKWICKSKVILGEELVSKSYSWI